MSDLPEDSNVTLEKWPFWLGDAIFVIVALSIAFTNGEGMGIGSALAATSCVLIGTVILLIPYYLEFSVRAKHQVQESEAITDTRLKRIDHEITRLNEAREEWLNAQGADQDKFLMTIGGKFEALKTQVETLSKKLNKPVKAEDNSANEKRFDAVEKTLAEIQQSLLSIQSTVESGTPSADLPPPGFSDSKPLDGANGRLMDKAFGAEPKSETGSGAIDRIIRSDLDAAAEDQEQDEPIEEKVTEPEKEELAEETVEAAPEDDVKEAEEEAPQIAESIEEAKDEEASVVEEETKEEEKTAEPEVLAEEKPESAPAFEDIVAAAEAEVEPKTDETIVSIEVADQPEESGEKPADKAPEPVLAETAFGFDDEVSKSNGNPLRAKTRRRRSKKADKQETRITVEALIGIGNKPYLRGNAAGLSEDKGIPMDYVEIGKWEWVSNELTEPANCHVYLNDETPASDTTELKPGDNLVVSPAFA